ncbi:MAG: alpha/beta fold hydrolase [Pseudomonadota bacterium]
MNSLPRIAAVAAVSLFYSVNAPAVEQDVKIPVGEVDIAGTLLTTEGAVAAAVIVAGSGPTDRNGNSAMLPGANNSLKYLAEALAARGIASLRYDKRMIGESQVPGLSEQALSFDMYVDDAIALAKHMGSQTRLPTFLIGHSEGGHIAISAAEKTDAIAGIAVVAGPGQHPADLISAQLAPQLPPALLAEANSTMNKLRAGQTVSSPPAGLEALFRPSVQPYMVSWFAHDPQTSIASLELPILLVYGDTDLQVPPSQGQLLATANPNATLIVIAGMNHVLKSVDGDKAAQMPSYGDPNLPIAPELTEAIAAFFHAQSN